MVGSYEGIIAENALTISFWVLRKDFAAAILNLQE
jgi:hypothetical protein